MARWLNGLCFLALGFGCVARGPSEAADPLLRTLDTTDHTIERGRDADAFDEALDIYASLAAEAPDDLRVAERLTRALYLRGYAFPERMPSPETFYESARATGWRCLSAGTGLVLGSVARGSKLETAGYERLDKSRSGCMVYTTLAWARWIALRGSQAMALDLEPLKALATGTLEVAELREAGKASHAYALVLALDAANGGTPWDEAEEAFQKAISHSPEDFSRVVDWVEWVMIPTGRQHDARKVLREIADAQPVARANAEQAGTPSDVRAFERAAALLVGLSTKSLTASEADRLDQE